MTAPSNTFIDIRFPKDVTTSWQASNHQSFWAFSGKARTTFHDAGGQQYAADMPYTAHCRFDHEIDSRGQESIASGDEGDMFMLTNGDCLEMGMMVNPISRQKELYKEYWHTAEKLPTGTGDDDSNVCIVASVSSPAEVSGVVIRVGGRVQGITSRRHQDGTQTVEVERWVRDTTRPVQQASEHSTGAPAGPWSRDTRSSGSLPCGWLCMPGRQVGDNGEHNGIRWQITEVHD